MTDREKFIKWLGVCIDINGDCDGCPYFEPVKATDCVRRMMEDILLFLSQQGEVKK